jgi:hypothetical protein
MLLVQEYLLTHSLLDLENEFGVFATFSKDGRKFSLNYDQILARDSDAISQECRGLILAAADGSSWHAHAVVDGNKLQYSHIVPGVTQVVAMPFKRFFNFGQGAAASISLNSTVRIMEKMDGTLTILYHDQIKNEWHVATRSIPEADVPLNTDGMTFRALFEKALASSNKTFDGFTSTLDKDLVYMFELCTPYNQVVVRHNHSTITLLAVRNKKTLEEVMIDDLDIGVPCVKKYSFNTMEEILAYVGEQPPSDHEGVVLLDSKFNRIKVKNPKYVLAHKAQDSLKSERQCMHAVLLNAYDDLLPLISPEISANILSLVEKLKSFLVSQEAQYVDFASKAQDKKSFALSIKDNDKLWKSAFFARFDKKVSSFQEYIQKNKQNGEFSASFLDSLLANLN